MSDERPDETMFVNWVAAHLLEEVLPITQGVLPRGIVDDAAKKLANFSQRFRPRAVLVAQCVTVLRSAAPEMDGEEAVNLAHRLIDAMGTAVLVIGDAPQTANIERAEPIAYDVPLSEVLKNEGRPATFTEATDAAIDYLAGLDASFEEGTRP